MTGERRGPPPPDMDDLQNEETIRRILVSGSDADLSRLAAFHSLSLERTAFMRANARTRYELVEASHADYERRLAERPTATPEEISAGVYAEQLERPVREAVFALRRKGYPTVSSGFLGVEGGQHLALGAPMFDDAAIAAVRKAIEGAFPVVIEPSSPTQMDIRLTASMDPAELTKMWDAIAQALPDRGAPAPPKARPYHGIMATNNPGAWPSDEEK